MTCVMMDQLSPLPLFLPLPLPLPVPLPLPLNTPSRPFIYPSIVYSPLMLVPMFVFSISSP